MKSIKATETKISKLYSNEEADAFIKYSRERFDAALNALDKEIHIVKRYMKKPELYSREELNSTVYDINRFRREADKVKRDNLLTDEDRGFVDMLHAGKLRPENVDALLSKQQRRTCGVQCRKEGKRCRAAAQGYR